MLAGNATIIVPPSYELISTAYGTGSSGTITFSSIPSTYKHLQIRYAAATTAGGDPTLYMRVNGDTGNSYAYHRLFATGASVLSNKGTIISYMDFDMNLADPTYTDVYAPAVIDILDYASTSKNKTVRAFTGLNRSGYTRVALSSGAFFNTAAVTSVSLFSFSAMLTTGSRFSLYGIKG
jgi:hypothetical protein